MFRVLLSMKVVCYPLDPRFTTVFDFVIKRGSSIRLFDSDFIFIPHLVVSWVFVIYVCFVSTEFLFSDFGSCSPWTSAVPEGSLDESTSSFLRRIHQMLRVFR